jgi:hypothetical protein
MFDSRYVNRVSVVNWPLRRPILSVFANRYIRAVTGMTPRDCTSGFRCWRREVLLHIPLERIVSEGYAFLVEMLFEAHRRGFRIGEAPIIFVERRAGKSKMSRAVITESVLMPWRLVCRKRLSALAYWRAFGSLRMAKNRNVARALFRNLCPIEASHVKVPPVDLVAPWCYKLASRSNLRFLPNQLAHS